MMLRMPNALTLTSQAKSRSAVTSVGHAIAAARLAMLFGMARLDRFAQMANQAVERFIFGHRDGSRSRQLDCQLVNNGGRPATHDQHPIGEEGRFADAVGDENHCLAVVLPDT